MAFENSPFRYGAQQPTGYAGTQVEVDQGLRTFMLGVYNNMVVGLGISGLVALGLNMASVAAYQGTRPILTPFGQTLYLSPLKWVLMLAPLAFIFVFSMRMDRMSASSARTMFFAFAAVMGASMSSLLLVFTGGSVVQVFFITAAAFKLAQKAMPKMSETEKVALGCGTLSSQPGHTRKTAPWFGRNLRASPVFSHQMPLCRTNDGWSTVCSSPITGTTCARC